MQKLLKQIAGPLGGILTTGIMWQNTGDFELSRMAGIAIWMALWWILESFSIYITALLPVVLYPIFGIMSMQEVAPLYTHEIIFLFIGGFLLAFCLEKWNLHKRLAWHILRYTGSDARGVLLGSMLSAWALSMWISNIAALLMLLPAVRGIAEAGIKSESTEAKRKFNTALLLGLAYACSLGGIATLVGTAPNMIFLAFYEKNFPTAPPLTFLTWMLTALPISALMFAFTYGVLVKLFVAKGLLIELNNESESELFKQFKRLNSNEIKVLILFLVTVILWCFREDISINQYYIPGWSDLLPWPEMVKDSTVAMLMAILLLLVPDGKGSTLLTWKEVQKIPIGILFLFGGGFALAEGIQKSGLSEWIGNHLMQLSNLSPWIIVIILATFMTFFTEITSNTAATYLVLPIVLSLSNLVDLPPLALLMPVVISASMAFMLPVATPPNTVIFSTETIRIQDMAKTGFILNIAGIVIITGITYLVNLIF
jgi:solute carrier family 13 (sodium-dependent dicarboxylate transporter), member 2/3/5